MRNPFKRIKALEDEIQAIKDSRYKIELIDGGIRYVQPSEAVLVYAPYIARVQIGPKAENMTQLILLFAELFGHPNYRGIQFYDALGTEITKEMQQAFKDRGLSE